MKSDIRGGQHDALGFSGCPRRIDDRHWIFVTHLRAIERDAVHSGEDLVKQEMWWRIGEFCWIPLRNVSSPQQTRAGVLSFIMATSSAGACRKYKRDDDQPFGHGSQIHGDPANAIRGEQSAPIAFLQSFGREKSSRLAHHVQQLAARSLL